MLTHSDLEQLWGMADTVVTVPDLVDLSLIMKIKCIIFGDCLYLEAFIIFL